MNFCYTFDMKTAISIPDPIFEAADGCAHRLGMSRSELYTKAVTEYIQRHKTYQVREKLDAIYAVEDSGLENELDTMQIRSIPKEEW